MVENFRERAKDDFARILVYWRQIERWIKQAEQVSNEAVIPAINELRYASRQLFNAQRLFDKDPLNEGEESVIRRRLIIAEQYLTNADHDVVDGISAYYKKVVRAAENELGRTAITVHFPEFPLLQKILHECDLLIAEAREDYSKRIENYSKIRGEKFPQALSYYDSLISAEVGAREVADQTTKDLLRAQGKLNASWWFGSTGWLIAVIAIIFSVVSWAIPYEEFCTYDNRFVKAVCSLKPPKTAANTPSTPVTPDGGAPPPSSSRYCSPLETRR